MDGSDREVGLEDILLQHLVRQESSLTKPSCSREDTENEQVNKSTHNISYIWQNGVM